MIFGRKEIKIVLEALIYMLKSAYTEEEILEHFDNNKELAKPTFEKRKEKLLNLKKMIKIFQRAL